MTCVLSRAARWCACVAVLIGVVAVLAGVAAGSAAAPPAAPPAVPADGTQRMVLRLDVIAETTNPWANIYANSARLELFSHLPVPKDTRLRLRHDFQIANEMLLCGRTQEAIALLSKLEDEPGADGIRSLVAAAYLRLGEQRNCLAHHGPESCLLPFEGSGIHVDPDPARQALLRYLALLERDPDDLSARWLLNVAAMALGEHPGAVPAKFLIPAAAFRSEHDVGRFRELAGAAGLATTGLAGGVATEDFDGDGDLDVIVSSAGLRDQLRYLRNDANGTWSDRTREAGLLGIVGGLNLTSADYDNDGRVDVLVLRGAWLGIPPASDGGRHPNSLLRNLGGGRFADVTEAVGLLAFRPSQAAAWADFDGDGRLDLFVGSETLGTQVNPSQFYRQQVDGTFVEVALASGVEAIGVVKGCAFGDIDNDGRPDLYVSRLGAKNLLFHNDGPAADGGWRFTEVAARAGVAEPVFSFPTWFFDYDNDGWEDLFVAGYATGRRSQGADVAADYLGLEVTAELPRLYRNRGDGTFEDVTKGVRLDRVAFTMGANFGDLDGDGFLDLYLGTGDPDLRALVPNRMFRNDGARRFQDVTTSGGFGHLQKGHGIAFADLDGDGDQDVMAVMGGFYETDVYPNVVFENPGHGTHWLTLQLEGRTSNRGAVGARVAARIVEGGVARDVRVTVGTGGSFGCSSLRQVLGLGRAEVLESVSVTWPTTGRTQRFEGLAMDRAWLLREDDPAPVPLGLPTFRFPAAAAGQHHHEH